jgi:ubiquinone/menaquinone biosynthesis C-methylase UbiE
VNWARNIFVRNAKLYELVLEGMWKAGEDEAMAIGAVLQDRGMTGCKVLDVPSGIGRIGIPLAQLGFSVAGLDFSSYLIDVARRKSKQFGVSKNASFYVGDMHKMKFEEGEFDCAINVFTSIGYESEKEDLEFLRGLRRVVKRGGLFFISGLRNRDYIITHASQNVYEESESLLVLDRYEFDVLRSRERGSWRFFLRAGGALRLAGEFPISIRIYSPHELVAMLEATDWKLSGVFQSFVTKSPFSTGSPVYSLLAEAV